MFFTTKILSGPFLLLIEGGDVVTRATVSLIISLAFIFFLSGIAFYFIRTATRNIRQDTPDFQRYLAKEKESILLKQAIEKRKEVEAERETPKIQPAEEYVPTTDQVNDLMKTIERRIGNDCPHCQTLMLESDDLVICPHCETVHHKVCFELSGCLNACKWEFVVAYPGGYVEKLKKKA